MYPLKYEPAAPARVTVSADALESIKVLFVALLGPLPLSNKDTRLKKESPLAAIAVIVEKSFALSMT